MLTGTAVAAAVGVVPFWPM
ncbi:hypothetical protein [Streptomyces capitiformicae]